MKLPSPLRLKEPLPWFMRSSMAVSHSWSPIGGMFSRGAPVVFEYLAGPSFFLFKMLFSTLSFVIIPSTAVFNYGEPKSSNIISLNLSPILAATSCRCYLCFLLKQSSVTSTARVSMRSGMYFSTKFSKDSYAFLYYSSRMSIFRRCTSSSFLSKL